MLQKLQEGNTNLLHPAGHSPGWAYSQGQGAERSGKGYTKAVSGMCNTALGHSQRRDGLSPNVICPLLARNGGELHGIATVVKLHVIVAGDDDGIKIDLRGVQGNRQSGQADHITGRTVIVDLNEVVGLASLFGCAFQMGLTDYSDFHVVFLLFVIFR